jgi:hypothetical protein
MLRALAISALCLAGGCTASVATLLAPVQVETPERAIRVQMGWPVSFVFQDMSHYDPPSWPNTYSVLAPQEHPTSVHLGWFAFSVLFFAASLGALVVLLRQLACIWRASAASSSLK